MKFFVKKSIKKTELCSFTDQLGTLLLAGVSIVSALTALLETPWSSPLLQAMKTIKDDINNGAKLGSAMEMYPDIFPYEYINMIKAGEESGRLGETLKELFVYMDKSIKIRNKIKSAMTYPLVVLVMAMSILFFLMTFIVPKFATIFAEIIPNGKLPALTLFVMSISNILTSNVPFVILGGIILVTTYKLLYKLDKFAKVIDKIKLNIPVFGTLMHKALMARFCATLSSLLKTGVRILPALKIVKNLSKNSIYQEAVQHLLEGVKTGNELHAAMKFSPTIFSATTIAMIKVGEKTGKVEEMLRTISSTYENEVDTTISSLTSIIEPLLIVFLAVVVGTIVIALFMPLISIIGSLSN